MSKKPDAPAKPRNLSHERAYAHLVRVRDTALAAVPAHAAEVVSVPKRDAKGAIVLDTEGFSVLVEKKVLTRDVIAAKYDAQLDAAKAQYGL